ncbi:Uncharacterized phage-associated protein [Thermoanaerobacter thermohydrosulfuricus]|nr:Uncharacterized phage-associated protein [Thermoanaerobacter thermohydrosulfuricus]
MGKVIYLNKGGLQMKKEVTVFDIAKAFLTMQSMTHKKLQKLCYYAQAWHLALYKNKLFKEDFEPWIHGPVCRDLYNVYKEYGWNNIPKEEKLPDNISSEIYEFLKVVFNTYGEFTGDELEAISHSELPWREARKGLEEWEPSVNRIIDPNIMRDYYSMVYEQSQND